MPVAFFDVYIDGVELPVFRPNRFISACTDFVYCVGILSVFFLKV